jgi:hypothetical protein
MPSVGVCGLPAGEILKPFYQSFGRAVRRLVETGMVVERLRKLRSLDELVQYYPYKTTDRWVKELREQLLPIARQVAERSSRKYSTAENEAYLLADVPEDAQQRWPSVEAQLFDLMGELSGLQEPERTSRRGVILRATVRGRQLFDRPSDVSCVSSFGSIIAEIQRTPPMSEHERPTYAAVAAFYEECFPRDEVARVEMKTRLMAVADFGRSGASSLTSLLKRELLLAAPQMIEQMPGHVPAPPSPTKEERANDGYDIEHFLMAGLPREGPTFAPLLDKLIQRDAIASFAFLHLAPQAGIRPRRS